MSFAHDIAALHDDEPSAVSVAAAAAEVGVSQKTIRQWIRDGAPIVREGKCGPNNGALVNVSDLLRWRYMCTDDTERLLERVADALLATLRREHLDGKPAHAILRIPPRNAAQYLLAVYDRLHFMLTGTDANPQDAPESLQILLVVANSNPNVRI